MKFCIVDVLSASLKSKYFSKHFAFVIIYNQFKFVVLI